ncbi:hypothetical protein ABW20_dc0104196 [Dactylellina cionopaga]|nr:hypothetical protein ABW20_dc0104196 [Dactylellina cionopaga]
MSATKTLKLFNTITTTTSASHRRRRSSAAAVTAAAFAPMFQSNLQQTSYFPHCQPQQLQLIQQQQQQQYAGHGPSRNDGGVSMQYHHFLPAFVTPTTPASSDHQTSYHGTNVTSPPPYYFHTPPISSIGGAGGAAILGNGRNAVTASGLSQHQGQSQQQQQQLFHSNPNAPQAGVHSGNHSPNHAVAGLHHTRTNSLHQDALNKKHAARPSLSQFSVASSHHFQFAFEAQPPQFATHDSIINTTITSPTSPNNININNNNINNNNNNINTPAVTPTFSKPAAAASHSRQSSLQQVQTISEPQPQQQQQQQQQKQQPQQKRQVVATENSGFSFLCLNPEPIQTSNPRPVAQPQLKPPSCGLLPGGFFSLTPEDSYPPLCTSTQPSTTLRENQQGNSYFPIMPVNPVVQQIAPRNGYQTGYMRPTYQRLTRNAVATVDSRDSREFRWNRVLRYVHDISAPHGASFPPSESWVQQQRLRIMTVPRQDASGDSRSLWDGGSLGTNGVDDFIWDDDLQNGKRFTIPPKSNQGDAPGEEDNLVFTLEPSKTDYQLAFGYEVDDSSFHPPAKRTKSNESQKAARRGLHEYLAALKSFELSHVQDMKRDAPLTMA